MGSRFVDWLKNNPSIYCTKQTRNDLTVLEFGAGIKDESSTFNYFNVPQFENGRVFSVENDRRWTRPDKFENLHYIIAPIERGWYSYEKVLRGLDAIPEIDIIVVDGPLGFMEYRGKRNFSRFGFYHFYRDHLHKKAGKCPILFDDYNRKHFGEVEAANRIAKEYGFCLDEIGCPVEPLESFAVLTEGEASP